MSDIVDQRGLFGLILCGGGSTRMGAIDKAELVLSGQRLIDIAAAKLSAQVSPVFLSTAKAYGLAADTLPDHPDGPKGPAAGLYSAWQHMRGSDYNSVITVPVDGPNLPDNLVSRLYAVDGSAIARDAAGRHPCFGLWREADLTRAFGGLDTRASLSMNRLADLCGAQEVRWAGADAFINLNTPDDVQRYRQA